jgi:hypothetical protein
MTLLHSLFKSPARLVPAWGVALVAACGGGDGGLGPGFGLPEPGAAPTVTATSPAASTPIVMDVATNRSVRATFSQAMAGGTLTPASFSLACPAGTPVTATVGYDTATQVATLTPGALLPANTTCVATVTTAAQDTEDLALASDYVWSFSTGAAPDTTAPTAGATGPADGATNICLTATVTATFSEPMDPLTITSAGFAVTDAGTPVAGTVSYNPTTRVAGFVAANSTGFAAGRPFVVTIRSGTTGPQDEARNPLAADRVFGFTTGTQPCAAAVDLRTAASFAAFGGGSGVTNQGANTVVGGDIGTTAACTLITGLHDAANVFSETPLNIGLVTGTINCGPPAPGTTTTLALAAQARADALTAFNALAAMPAGSDPGAGQLGGLVLAPGVYTSAGGAFAITTGDLTLDAQGDADAVWVFQMPAALTVGLTATPRTVLLINGAQARNVFWQVGSAARIEDGSTMVGTLIAPAGVTISTAGQTAQTTLTGRAIGLTASVTMVNTTIVAP